MSQLNLLLLCRLGRRILLPKITIVQAKVLPDEHVALNHVERTRQDTPARVPFCSVGQRERSYVPITIALYLGFKIKILKIF